MKETVKKIAIRSALVITGIFVAYVVILFITAWL